MALELGGVFTRVGFKLDDSDADRYERRTDKLRRESRKDIETDARLDVDRRGFDQFERGTKNAANDADRLERKTGRMGGAIGAVAKGAGAAGLVLGGGLALGAKKAWTEFEEAAKVGAQTEAVIKSTGGAANVTAEDVSKLAGALSAKAGIDDEAIQSGANLLLTFKEVRNEAGAGNDVFDQTTKAALDMSVAMGTDMRSASMMLGKALNDPEKGLSKLARSGVTFTEQQKEQVAALQESGDMLGAQKIILKEVNSEFAGSAEAQARPLDRAKVAVMNLFEAVGTKLAPVIEGAATFFADFVEQLTVGAEAGGAVGDNLERLGDTAKGVVGWFKDLVDAFRGGDEQASAFSKTVVETAREWWAAVKSVVKSVTQEFDGMGGSLEILGRSWLTWMSYIMGIVRRVLPYVAQVWQGLARTIAGVVDVIAGILTLDFGRVWEGVKKIVSGALKVVLGLLKTFGAAVLGALSPATRAVGSVVRRIVGFFADLPGDVWGWLKRTISRVGTFASQLAREGRDAGRGFLRRVVDFVRDLPGDVWGWLRRTVTRAATFGTQLAREGRDAGRTFVRRVVDFIGDLPGRIWSALKRGVSFAARFGAQLASEAAQAGRTFVRRVISFVNNLPGDLWGVFKSGLSRAASFASQLAERGRAAGRGAVNGVINFVKGLPGRLKSVGSSAASAFASGIGSLGGKIKSALGSVGGIASDVGNAIRSWVNSNTLFGNKVHINLPGPKDIDFTLPALAQGGSTGAAARAAGPAGRVGPGAGGPVLILAGEGGKDEWVISQEGDRSTNIGYALEALAALGVNVTAAKKGRKGKGRKKAKPPPKPKLNAGQMRSFARIGVGLPGFERGIQDAEHAYDVADRRFNMSEEEYVVEDAAGNAYVDQGAVRRRVAEIDALIQLRAKVKAAVQRYRDAIKMTITQLNGAIGRLKKALGAAKGKRRSKERENYSDKIGEYQERVGELGGVFADLGYDLDDSQIDAEELWAERGAVNGSTAPPPAPADTPAAEAPAAPVETGPTPEEIAALATEQFRSFQASRQDLFREFGANFMPGAAAGGGLGGSAMAQAAGLRAFGLEGTGGLFGRAGVVGAREGLSLEITNHFGSGPGQPTTWAEGQRHAVQAAFS